MAPPPMRGRRRRLQPLAAAKPGEGSWREAFGCRRAPFDRDVVGPVDDRQGNPSRRPDQTEVYKRTAQLDVSHHFERRGLVLLLLPPPSTTRMAIRWPRTGSYQPGGRRVHRNSDGGRHLPVNDPTTAGPEPVIPTTGTPAATGDTPLTIETDLNRAHPLLLISPTSRALCRRPPGAMRRRSYRPPRRRWRDGLHPRGPDRRRQARNRGARWESLDRLGVHHADAASVSARGPPAAGCRFPERWCRAMVPADFPPERRCCCEGASRRRAGSAPCKPKDERLRSARRPATLVFGQVETVPERSSLRSRGSRSGRSDCR